MSLAPRLAVIRGPALKDWELKGWGCCTVSRGYAGTLQSQGLTQPGGRRMPRGCRSAPAVDLNYLLRDNPRLCPRIICRV
eukprot:755130-Hanusia_phi.AAC.1